MKENKLTIYFIIKLAVFSILGILVLIFKNTFVEHLKYFIGGLLLLYGIEEIGFEIATHRKKSYLKEKVYLGFVELILGVVLLAASLSFEVVCVIWATWAIIRESYELKEVAAELEHLVPRAISGIESVVVIAFSVELIIVQDAHAAGVHMYLLVVELVCTPLVPLLEEILLERKQKKNEQNQQDC